MADEISATPPVAESLDRVTLHYLKSNLFRTIHCDGVVGGPSPNGRYIHMSVFSDRTPIPVEVVHAFKNGKLGDPLSQSSRSGVVREIEADVVMDLNAAKLIGAWLLKRVEEVEKMVGDSGDFDD